MQPARQDVAVPPASGLAPNPPRPLRFLRCIGRLANPQESSLFYSISLEFSLKVGAVYKMLFL